ncbi:NAD-dependent epimerase/dehydratase family protein [Myceligenerans pegani]|uniref:NAD(P)-dependent oxidoreductase n=1 Tax=Myceligenerans pegani TaxID=2776917 RepID=A0ABR9MYW4_9MICO|nr:NAD(P)-dependent oxidoreductase [Myceligenerans sp. TRM 65318]MBE1876583.1 NAD(P)-dependent oxidoreductase [Myceligenerans sp. TRM 65318]MBE3018854.1 NAD(P)-dependent oxidoreductase [Myceligenerans sp. TRM 65318]
MTHLRPPRDEAELDDLLSRPGEGVGDALDRLDGDVLILGAGGKIGPTMARMARRALDAVGSRADVLAVSRWSDPEVRAELESHGVRTVAADLADPASYGNLPDAAGLFFLTAMKFGTVGNEHRTWWTNTAIPAFVADRWRGTPTMVYSTGNVYGLSPVSGGGSKESDPPSPAGEYAQSCLGRERVFSAAAHEWGTPTTVFRLNYACELRYGVIADIAQTIMTGRAVDVTMPAVNVAWQGDISSWALRSIELASTPPAVLNATGPETVSVRTIADRLAERMGTALELTGTEAADALLSDAGATFERYGYPTVPLGTLIDWVAEWVGSGGRQLGKATKFQQRVGQY